MQPSGTSNRPPFLTVGLGRALDIGGSVTALVIFSPLMLVIAAAIYLESGWPVLFAQYRIGQHGRPFRILKFRKFTTANGSSGMPLTLQDDARLTRVGRILRVAKFDELPQLWNVLKGQMSIVGPRPESLAFSGCFCDGFEAVLQFKPGIFGPSQAAFRAESEFYPSAADLDSFYKNVLFPLKALIDLKYYPNRTIFSDLVWIGASVLATLGWVLPLVPLQEVRKRRMRYIVLTEPCGGSRGGTTLIDGGAI